MAAAAFFLTEEYKAQISDGIFGQNAHLTNVVGANTTAGGHLDEFWDKYGTYSAQNHIFDSKTKYMRYGGIGVEDDCEIDGTGPGSHLNTTIQDYIAKAIAMQDNGIVPMMTLPLKYGGLNPIATLADAATKASLLVKGVNDGLTATANTHLGGYYAPVIYWVYSNEPEQGGTLNHNYDGTDAAQKIHGYIKAYYDAIMVTGGGTWNGAWGSPKFVGPELYSYDNYNHGTGKVNRLIEQLTGRYNQVLGTNTGEFDIRPYISIFSWHYYPFNDEGSLTLGVPTPTRSNVINRLSKNSTVVQYGITPTAYTRKLKDDIAEVKGWLNTGGYSNLDVAITEANICHMNDINAANGTDDLITGNGANSFIGGQFWAEMMGVCMDESMEILNFWSSVEGYSGNSYATDVGFLNSKPGRFGDLGGKKPTYWHFKMLGENFVAGATYFAVASVSGPTSANYKALACTTATEIRVIIMNQDEQSAPRGYDNSAQTFSINFNNSLQTSKTINFAFNMGNSSISGGGCSGGTYCCSIQKEATMLLVFSKSTNAIIASRSQAYSLQDAMRGASDVGPNSYVGTAASTVTSSTDYVNARANNSKIYSTVTIAGTSAITPGTVGNNTFQFNTSAQINGASGSFSSGPAGNTLCITYTAAVPCQ
jgi:hypothetical protein